MRKKKLDKEEQNLLTEFECGGFDSVLTSERKNKIQAAAEETLKKDKCINIRMSSRDFEALQRRALEEGVPCQTLASSVLHKYVSGGLKDIMANKPRSRDTH